jgi:cystathionine gamma-lyase
MNTVTIILLFINIIKLCLSKKLNNKNFATRIVHAGSQPNTNTGNIIPSISLGTTFAQIMPGVKPGINDINSHGTGYFYSRQANPTRGALEIALANAENAKHAAVFSSGMAAISTVIQTLNSGDHVIALNDLYGGTYSYFKDIATPANGINFSFIDVSNTELLLKTISSKTKLIWIESPTNPLLKTIDIRGIAMIAKRNNCLLVVDSTFSSPYLINPLNLGVDIVVHSATKFIGGHSDILMGAIICNCDNLIKKIRFIQTGIGAVPSPFECYLTMRGLKTLHLRMDASQKNAMKIAKFLEKHPLIKKVIYPGLKSYKYYDLAKLQTRGSGSMITMYINGDIDVTKKFLESLKIFTLAVSLGAVESLICSPAIMTHASIPKDIREKNGLTDNLIRISVGIEDIDDLIKDLKQALNKANTINKYKNN